MTAGFDECCIIIKNRSHNNDCGFESYRYINAVLVFLNVFAAHMRKQNHITNTRCIGK